MYYAVVDTAHGFNLDNINAHFSSNHPNTVNYLYGDGSVHGLSTQLDPLIRGQMAIRNDGLPLGSP
jgi:prepilin-type processing-associated H-X9-DG protein